MISDQEYEVRIDPDRPFFSHATKDFQYFTSIVRGGSLICPEKLSSVIKFSGFADEYTGRTKYVMFSPGFGYIIDNANMQVSFLFSDRLLKRAGAVLHLRPVVFAICEIIVRVVKQKQCEYWIDFFSHQRNLLDHFNHPLVKMTFREYMVEFLSGIDEKITYGDGWGASTYSEGVIKILYESNPTLRPELAQMISTFNASNTLGGRRAQEHLERHWKFLSIYKSSQQRPLSDTEKTHTQLLVPDHVSIWKDGLLGFCVSRGLLREFTAILRTVLNHIPTRHREQLHVYSGRDVHSIDELLMLYP